MKNIILLCSMILIITITNGQDVSTFCDAGVCYQKDQCYVDPTPINKVDYSFARVGNIFGNDPNNYKMQLTMSVYSACTLPDPSTVPFNPSGPQATIANATCTNCKRPFILLIHAGGFSYGCRNLLEDECIEFARHGYVAATIDYRLGWKTSQSNCYTNLGTTQFCMTDPTSINCPETSQCSDRTGLHAAMYKAIQDAHAALRYMAYYAPNFNIDNNYFYIGGQSAGSITAVNLTYMNQSELNTVFSDLLDVDGNNIYGKYDNNGNKLQAAFSLKGLYNCWGAIGDDNAIKGQQDKIPMIAFQCQDDNVVPYGEDGPVLKFACGNQLDKADGCSAIYSKLITKYAGSVACEFYHQVTGGHGGILNTTDDEKLKRIELAICFFRKCREGYTTQTDFDLSNGDNTTVVCDASLHAKKDIVNIKTANLFNIYVNSKITHVNFDKSLPSAVYVYNVTGTMVSKTQAVSGNLTINCASLSSGICVVKIIQSNRSATQKIVLQ